MSSLTESPPAKKAKIQQTFQRIEFELWSDGTVVFSCSPEAVVVNAKDTIDNAKPAHFEWWQFLYRENSAYPGTTTLSSALKRCERLVVQRVGEDHATGYLLQRAPAAFAFQEGPDLRIIPKPLKLDVEAEDAEIWYPHVKQQLGVKTLMPQPDALPTNKDGKIHAVKDENGNIWVVKLLDYSTKQASRELFVNLVLKHRKVCSTFLTMHSYCFAELTATNITWLLLIFPYLDCYVMQDAYRHDSLWDDEEHQEAPMLTAKEWAAGMHAVTHALALTDPNMPLTESGVRLWHSDLHPGNILIDKATKKFYIIDFGLSSIQYRDSIYSSVKVESSEETNFEREVEKFCRTISTCIPGLQNDPEFSEDLLRLTTGKISVSVFLWSVKRVLKKLSLLDNVINVL